MEEHYYHISHWGYGKDEGKVLRVTTICTLSAGNMTLARGVSICCPLDRHNRKWGNMIARGRAYKALKKQTNSSPIREELKELIKLPFQYKCMYLPDDNKGIQIKVNLKGSSTLMEYASSH